MLILGVVTWFVSFGSTAIASPVPFPPPPNEIPGATTFIYKETKGFKLPIYVFLPPEDARPETGSPTAVLYFHGSGWESGTVLQFAGHARLLAQRGITAALVEYRIKTMYGATPFDAVADAKSAIRWARQNASMLNVPTNRIVAIGGSAGGHIALASAVFEDRFDDPADDQTISARPDALVLFAPIVDTTSTGYADGVPLFVGRDRELSPVHHLKSGMPPSLIFLGTRDKWVSQENIQRMEAGMRSLKNSCEVILFEGRSHFFYNHPDYFELRPKMKASDSIHDFPAVFYLTERFLHEQGFQPCTPRVVQLP